jgi:sugar lactone lactonase YvrE
VICVKCGVNLVTGKELTTSLGGPPQQPPALAPDPVPANAPPEIAPAPHEFAQGGEEPRGGGVVRWFGECFPGVFRPRVVVGAIILSLVAWIPAIVLASPAVTMASVEGAGLGQLMVIGLAVALFSQALAWLITGEYCLFSSAITEFTGRDWSNIAILNMIPVVLLFLLTQAAITKENAYLNAPLPSDVVEEQKAQGVPPEPGEYVISGAGGGTGSGIFAVRGSGLAMDPQGCLYYAHEGGCIVWKYNPATNLETVIAGNGERGFYKEGGVAVKESLNRVSSVAVDGNSNVYIADAWQVRKVDPKGIITTFAGSGKSGTGGDGGPARQAELTIEMKLCADAKGNLYIVDPGRPLIRRVDAATGIIASFAGTGRGGFSGDGGPAVNAALAGPRGLAVDAKGNLYVADSANRRIRKVDVATGLIDTIAGSGKAGLAGVGGPATAARLLTPIGVAVDSKGNVFILGTDNRVRKVDGVTGILSIAAGTGDEGDSGDGGPAGLATLRTPVGIAIGPGDTIFIADQGGSRLRKLVKR